MDNEKFEKELTQLLNRHSKDSELQAPDYLLAEYIVGCLCLLKKATARSGEINEPKV